jgi:hypothetical protein
MPVVVSCPECDRRLKIAEAKVGKPIRCPDCDEVFKARPPAGKATRGQAHRPVPKGDADGKGLPWLMICACGGAVIVVVAAGLTAFFLTRPGGGAKPAEDPSQVQLSGQVDPNAGGDAAVPKGPSAGPTAGWTSFAAPDGGFSVLLPGPATSGPFVVKNLERRVRGEQHSHRRADRVTFMALSLEYLQTRATADYRPGPADLEDLVSRIRFQIAGRRGGLERANRAIDKDGCVGRELRFESQGTRNLAGKFYLVQGPRSVVYGAVVFGPGCDTTGPEADAFLDSLTFHRPDHVVGDPGGRPPVRPTTPADGSDAHAVVQLTGDVKLVRFSQDGRVLLGGADLIVVDKMHAKCWETTTFQETANAVLPAGATAAAFDLAPDGRTAALVESNRQVHLVDLVEGKSLARLGRPANKIGFTTVQVACAPDGKSVATVHERDVVRLWDVATYRERCQVKIPPTLGRFLTFSPDGKLLAVSLSLKNDVLLFDAFSGARVATLTGDRGSGALSRAVFSARGDLLAVGWQDKTVRFFDLGTSNQLPAIRVENPVSELALSPDGSLLATASAGGNVFLWDVGTGQKRAVLNAGRNNKIAAMAFSPDGKRLAVGNIGRVQVWDVGRVALLPVNPRRNLKVAD